MAFISAVPLHTRVAANRAQPLRRPRSLHVRSTFPSRLPPCVSRTNARTERRPPRAALSTGYGHSTLADTAAATREALAAASAKVSAPTVALLTCTSARDTTVLYDVLRAQLPDVAVHGVTTHRALLTNARVLPDGVGVLLLSSPGLATAAAEITSDVSAYDAARTAAEAIVASKPSTVLFHATPGAEAGALAGAASVLGPDVQLFGGSAADEAVAGDWKLLTSSGALSAGVSLLGVSGPVKCGASLRPPYAPTAISARITRADGRTIHELDGGRAADVLAGWMGGTIDEQARDGGSIIVESAGFPMGIQRANGAYVSVHAAELTADGAIGLFAEAETGETLTVMSKAGGGSSATAASIGLREAYDEAMHRGGLTDPAAGVAIYCGGLSIAVGGELEDSLAVLEGKAPLLGMTVFGEQGDLGGDSLHCNLAVGIALFE